MLVYDDPEFQTKLRPLLEKFTITQSEQVPLSPPATPEKVRAYIIPPSQQDMQIMIYNHQIAE